MNLFSKPSIEINPEKIDEILSRGVENVFPSKDFLRAKLLRGERITIYLGVDPTGPTLHLGHVIPLRHLAKLQALGHQVILLIGDFTAMIGDPTDKTATRKKLTRDEVLRNCKEYQKQASKFISFTGPNKALIKYNSEWLGKMDFGDVLELASLMTVDQMLKRDMFKRRMEEGKPVYIHEFMYPLMQGYDSVAMDVDGEIGGNDQTFNMLAGRDLQKSLQNKEKFVIAMRLMTDSTGKKMGKTENNMVALDQSPEDMFGKVMSWSDELIIPGFEIATDVPLEKIESIRAQIAAGGNPREAKVILAKEIVSMCHTPQAAESALQSFEKTFVKGGVPEDVIEIEAAFGASLADILLAEKIVSSKSELRRLLSEGAVTHVETEEKETDISSQVKAGVYRVGKRRFIKIKVI